MILPEFMEFCEGCIMVAHNASFDMSFIEENCRRLGLPCEKTVVDTVVDGACAFAAAEPIQAGYGGESTWRFAGKSSPCRGRCGAVRQKFLKNLSQMLEKQDIETLEELNALGSSSESQIRKELPTYHAIILAKNDIGTSQSVPSGHRSPI